ncbi:hypothetical protein [Micromonospora sp. NPDC047740]|uniref:hypothetical protein n=1 Tax=Micromonospora sp. NPDC047740 TaxID=3364254 RepID=UPI003715B2D6
MGLLLAEAMPYVERAPWAALAPATALALLGAFAVTTATTIGPRQRRTAARQSTRQAPPADTCTAV